MTKEPLEAGTTCFQVHEGHDPPESIGFVVTSSPEEQNQGRGDETPKVKARLLHLGGVGGALGNWQDVSDCFNLLRSGL